MGPAKSPLVAAFRIFVRYFTLVTLRWVREAGQWLLQLASERFLSLRLSPPQLRVQRVPHPVAEEI